jgi:SAM-dependent methyltransferase
VRDAASKVDPRRTVRYPDRPRATVTDPRLAYYDALAPRYDDDRFGGPYGRYLHGEEVRRITAWMRGTPPERALDVACGTGRLLGFCRTGIDASPAMLDVARLRWPDRTLVLADAARLPFPDRSFDAVLCVHLAMHLPPAQLTMIGSEIARVLTEGGRLVIDAPAALRRRLRPRGAPPGPAWHGATAYDTGQLLATLGGFTVVDRVGTMVVPIQRLPARARRWAAPVDRAAGALFPDVASYGWWLLRRSR